MRSLWIQITFLLIYLLILFVIARILDVVYWCQHGVSPTRVVDPLVLSVRQLKHLLENRGVSYTGLLEKKELVQLVKDSAEVVQGEVEDLITSQSSSNGDVSNRDRLTHPPSSKFSGGSHFYEEVEDTKDSVWLVQVVPAGKGRQSEPLLDDYNWRVVCSQVAPFAIRTGVFDCRLDHRLCANKDWKEPMLLLALPKGTKPKDKVILRTYNSARPQMVVDWVRDQLSIRVANIPSIEEVENEWLGYGNSELNYTSKNIDTDVKVLFLSHLISPPLFLAALSIKFTGRVKFGMFSVRREETESVKNRLKILDHKLPCYIIITPEKKVIYGRRRLEYYNFGSMNLFLRVLQPEINDVFLCSLVIINTLISLQFFYVSFGSWWKQLARWLWIVVSYNLWLFSFWLLILGTYRFSLASFMVNKLLIVVRFFSLSFAGSLIRADWQLYSNHPYYLLGSFFIYGFTATYVIRRKYRHLVPEINSSMNHQWWEVLPVDSDWINYFFRPMSSLPRPMPSTDIELEEGIEMLIERLAVPTLWLQSVIPTEYIKELPVWKFKGWEFSVEDGQNNKQCITLKSCGSDAILRVMDGEDPSELLCCNCKNNSCIDSNHSNECSCSGTTSTNSEMGKCRCECMEISKHADSSQNGELLCGKCMKKRRGCDNSFHIKDQCLRFSENNSLHKNCDNGEENDHQMDLNNVDYGTGSDGSSDEGYCPPKGMLPVSECAVCLEAYSTGSVLCGLPCGHSYHQFCILMWLQGDNHHCPVCRWPAYKQKHSRTHLHQD